MELQLEACAEAPYGSSTRCDSSQAPAKPPEVREGHSAPSGPSAPAPAPQGLEGPEGEAGEAGEARSAALDAVLSAIAALRRLDFERVFEERPLEERDSEERRREAAAKLQQLAQGLHLVAEFSRIDQQACFATLMKEFHEWLQVMSC